MSARGLSMIRDADIGEPEMATMQIVNVDPVHRIFLLSVMDEEEKAFEKACKMTRQFYQQMGFPYDVPRLNDFDGNLDLQAPPAAVAGSAMQVAKHQYQTENYAVQSWIAGGNRFDPNNATEVTNRRNFAKAASTTLSRELETQMGLRVKQRGFAHRFKKTLLKAMYNSIGVLLAIASATLAIIAFALKTATWRERPCSSQRSSLFGTWYDASCQYFADLWCSDGTPKQQ